MPLRNTQHFSIQSEIKYMNFGTVNELILLQVRLLFPINAQQKQLNLHSLCKVRLKVREPRAHISAKQHALFCLCFCLHTQRQPDRIHGTLQQPQP